MAELSTVRITNGRVEVFGDNVLIDQVAKNSGPVIHLPDNMEKKEASQSMVVDFVVVAVGDECKRVKIGDKLVLAVPSYAMFLCDIGFGPKKYGILREGQIVGVQR